MHELLISLWTPIRWLHVLSGAAWFGEVAVINFILIPALNSYKGEDRGAMLKLIFPPVFRMASVLSATVVITGTVLVYLHTAGDLTLLTSSRWGKIILVGGTLGWFIAIFHFVIEHKILRHAGFDPDVSETAMADMHLKLTIIPRMAMAVLTAIFVLMMVAARGV